MRNIIYPIEYLNIISNAIRRGLTKKTAKQLGIGGHIHHIIPKTVAPELSKEKYNMVFLTYEEHYTVHKILAEANMNDDIAYAWGCMSTSKETKRFFTSEDYAIAMELSSNLKSKRMSGDGNYMSGKTHTDEELYLMSVNRKGKCCGEDNPMYGINTHELYGTGQKDKKIICLEYSYIDFKSIMDAERTAPNYGFKKVSASGIRGCINNPDKFKSCGKDAEGNKLHWALA